MEKFRYNNPDAEFMIIESGHGSSYEPIFAADFPHPADPDYNSKEGSHDSQITISRDFVMGEDYEKKLWQGAAGNMPLIILKHSCQSGAAIAKRNSSSGGEIYLAGDTSP